MKCLPAIAVVAATIAFASGALAEDGDVRQVIARADGNDVRGARAVEATAPGEYAGRYDTETGLVFVVVNDGDSLTIELPDTWTTLEARLRAESARDFVGVEVPVRVTFEVGADGKVSGLRIDAPDEPAPLTAIRQPLRRGVVTIHDIDEAVAGVTVAASS
jgi:hypothetical protein